MPSARRGAQIMQPLVVTVSDRNNYCIADISLNKTQMVTFNCGRCETSPICGLFSG